MSESALSAEAPSPYNEEEVAAGVAAVAAAVVPSGSAASGDIGDTSVASSSTHQTRFSFYNAEDYIQRSPVKSAAAAVEEKQRRFNFYNHHPRGAEGENKASSDGSDNDSDRDCDNGHDNNNSQQLSPPALNASVSGLATTTTQDDDRNEDSEDFDNDIEVKTASSSKKAPNREVQQDALDSVGILRSLQEHEQQRLEILSGGGSPKKKSDHRPLKMTSTSERIPGVVGTPTSAGSGFAASNPYEDAIKEALQLLRKHRTARPPNATAGMATNAVGAASGHLVGRPRPLLQASENEPQLYKQAAQTPPEADRLLQTRAGGCWMEDSMSSVTTTGSHSHHEGGGGLGEAYQAEIEARRKQRQERMARYASRLAELKHESNDENDGEAGGSAAANDDQQHHRGDGTALVERLVPQEGGSSVAGAVLSADRGAAREVPDAETDDAVMTHELVPSAASRCEEGKVASPGLSQKDVEVHMGVERVLLAILERANSRGRGGPATAAAAAAVPHSPSWQMDEKKSSPLEAELLNGGKVGAALLDDVAKGDNDALTRAMTDLLRCGSSEGSSSDQRYTQRQPRSSAVEVEPSAVGVAGSDQCLTETAVAGPSTPSKVSAPSTPLHHNQNANQTENLLDTSGGEIEAVRSDPDEFGSASANIHADTGYSHMEEQEAGTDHDELDEMVRMALVDGQHPSELHSAVVNGSSGAVGGGVGEKEDAVGRRVRDLLSNSSHQARTEESNFDDRLVNCVGVDTSERYEEDEPGGPINQDEGESLEEDRDSPDQSYTDEEGSEDLQNDTLDGVLGPLSKKAGGTTGVVLEADSPSSNREQQVTSPSFLDSFSAAMSLVTGAVAQDDSSPLQPAHDRYHSTDDDDEDDDDEEQEYTYNDESVDASSAVALDSEANELMRTLCAHLLPFGVAFADQSQSSQQLLERLPEWDESNPDEAGYRIIRLTKLQLHRVERAFDHMVQVLKHDSQHNLALHNSSTDSEAFERDLKEAEELLDREEKRQLQANKVKCGSDGEVASPASVGNINALRRKVSPSSLKDGEEDDERSVLSHFPGVKPAGKGEMGDLEFFTLPIIFKSHVTGFEPTKDLYLEAGNVIAGQYLVEGELGSAAFSTAYRCVDLSSEDTEGVGVDGHEEVCLKVIRNTKDFFDQSLDEIKILELLRQTGKCQEKCIVEMKTFFYHREHLVIVTELLRQNLFEFGKFILDNDEEPYFTIPRLSYITRQTLIALDFVHRLGLIHSDVKPENILLASYSRAKVKLIDFGSSCYLTDRQSSYIQSRSYRAPEVILGLPYDGRIDIWSLGCVVAEMFTGEVTFQNDSIVSMLSRIEAICGPFPRHMIAQGRQSGQFFTKCGLLFEKVTDDDDEEEGGGGDSEGSDDSDGSGDVSSRKLVDIFQPKITTLSARLGFDSDLWEQYSSGGRNKLSREQRRQAVFVDFIRKLLTVDPDGRPSAREALEHPWMVYAASLTEEDIKYPSS